MGDTEAATVVGHSFLLGFHSALLYPVWQFECRLLISSFFARACEKGYGLCAARQILI